MTPPRAEPVHRRKAVFLDRDGTLTEPRHYPSRPGDLVLQPDIGPPLRALQHEGWTLVVVTNQSGVARSFLTITDLEAMHERLGALLVAQDVRLDGIYACPHHPNGTVPAYRRPCPRRNPLPACSTKPPTTSGSTATGRGQLATRPATSPPAERPGRAPPSSAPVRPSENSPTFTARRQPKRSTPFYAHPGKRAVLHLTRRGRLNKRHRPVAADRLTVTFAVYVTAANYFNRGALGGP